MNPAEEALEPVLRDVDASFVSLVDGEIVDPAAVVLHGWKGTEWEVALDPDDSPAGRVVDVAEHAQDLIADLLHGAGLPAAWPGCPAHPDGHPLTARVVDGAAVWACPVGETDPVPIGTLPVRFQRIGLGRAPVRVPQRPDADQHLEPVIAAALKPVQHDLRAARGPVPRIADERWGHSDLQATAMLWGESAGAGVSVDREDEPLQQIVSAADGVQDWAIDELWRLRRPTNWPVCPAHPKTHPLRPELREDVPVWCCPVTGGAVARIGALLG